MFVREIPVHKEQRSSVFTLGLQVQSEDAQLKISKGQLIIEEMYLSVLSDRGHQKVNDNWNAKNNETMIDCSAWPKGSYYLSIRDMNRRIVKMFEVQKR